MNPFPGPRPFRGDEAQYFTGREAISKALATQVRVAPLTILAARSGIGKSSLLTCRVIPELERTARVHYWNEWGSDPPATLVERAIETLEAMPRRDGRDPPVLVLDQFEDTFKGTADTAPLWEALAGVVNVRPAPMHVLVAMREEWLARWVDGFDYLPDALTGILRLPPMSRTELRRAISLPSEREGRIAVEEATAEAILSDLTALATGFGVTGGGEPALLQVVLHTIWEDAVREGGAIDRARYEKLGRAEQIVRDYVWRLLGEPGTGRSGFDATGRVLWAGLSRYLTLAPGVKAIVTAESLARTLRLSDLGAFGPAIVTKASGKRGRDYLLQIPESRGPPPESLMKRIDSVLATAVDAGFLKRQSPRADATAAGVGARYELAHDFLGHFLQQFTVAVEAWTRTRWRRFKAFTVLLLIELYVLAWFVLPNMKKEPTKERVLIVVLAVVLTPLYFIFLGWLGRVLSHAATYPVARLLARGKLPRPRPAMAVTAVGRNVET